MALQKLNPRHDLMMRRLVLDGHNQNEVSEEFGVTASTLSILRSQPVWIEKENEMRSEAFNTHKKDLDKLVSPAITALKETVTSIDETIKLRSAKEILDRTGFIAGVRIETEAKPIIKMYIPKNWDHPSNELEDEKNGN